MPNHSSLTSRPKKQKPNPASSTASPPSEAREIRGSAAWLRKRRARVGVFLCLKHRQGCTRDHHGFVSRTCRSRVATATLLYPAASTSGNSHLGANATKVCINNSYIMTGRPRGTKQSEGLEKYSRLDRHSTAAPPSSPLRGKHQRDVSQPSGTPAQTSGLLLDNARCCPADFRRSARLAAKLAAAAAAAGPPKF